jgi:hypothetical protein
VGVEQVVVHLLVGYVNIAGNKDGNSGIIKMTKAEELRKEIDKLPIEEQKKFFEWARDYIKKFDEELKQKLNKEQEDE